MIFCESRWQIGILLLRVNDRFFPMIVNHVSGLLPWQIAFLSWNTWRVSGASLSGRRLVVKAPAVPLAEACA
jgi:hypothetical protein